MPVRGAKRHEYGHRAASHSGPVRDDTGPVGREGGFTLIEVIVSLVLFSLISTMLVSVLTLSIQGTGSARQTSQAFQIARSQLESIKLQAYAEPISYTTVPVPDDDFVVTIGGTVLKAGFLEQIDVTVDFPEGSVTLSGYKVKHFPPVLADFPLGAPAPLCPIGKECVTYYLHNNPTPPVADTNAQANLTMDTVSSPSFVRFNYDANHDTDPGLGIDKGGTVNSTNLTRFQNWRTSAFPSDVHIDGDVTLQLWSASSGFTQNRRGEIDVFLRDWNGSSYTEIASANLFKQDWQEGFEDFVVVTVPFASVDYTIVGGNALELKLVVGSNTQTPVMWFMYDFIDFDSKLFVTKEP